MRLSSIFAFVICPAILVSASPISNDNSRSNSLSKRLEHYSHPIEYRDGYDTVIRIEHGPHGDEPRVIVTFGHSVPSYAQAPRGPITFFPPEGPPEGEQHSGNTVMTFALNSNVEGLDFIFESSERQHGLEVKLTLFILHTDHGEKWMTFYPKPVHQPVTENGEYTFTVDHLFAGGYVRVFRKNMRELLLIVNAPLNGIWLAGAVPNILGDEIQWLPHLQ